MYLFFFSKVSLLAEFFFQIFSRNFLENEKRNSTNNEFDFELNTNFIIFCFKIRIADAGGQIEEKRRQKEGREDDVPNKSG